MKPCARVIVYARTAGYVRGLLAERLCRRKLLYSQTFCGDGNFQLRHFISRNPSPWSIVSWIGNGGYMADKDIVDDYIERTQHIAEEHSPVRSLHCDGGLIYLY